MTPEIKYSSVIALGKIESVKEEIEQISQVLKSVPLWRPASALNKQCQEVASMISALQERFDQKLVVTLIGPSGSGKSTLLNALAGGNDLSETGNRRPTTQQVVVLSSQYNDAEQLQREIGQDNVKILADRTSSALDHVILIDTPDTDSTEQKKHIPMVKRAIELSDILICLFDSENPKRRDHVDFLKPYIRLFHGDALMVTLNKCDRHDEKDLKENILPDFERYLQTAWDKPIHKILCICARNHLKNPRWDQQAFPRHDFDQFQQLRDIIFGTFKRPSFAIDRRLENAHSLKAYLFSEIQTLAQSDAETLANAKEQLIELEKKAAKEAVISAGPDNSEHMLGINVLLYQKLSQKWFGPVGWLIAIWARILIFGTGLAAIFRFGNPVKQIVGMVSSLIRFKTSQAAVAEVSNSRRAESSLQHYRLAILKHWPAIGETLIRGHFDHAVRNPEIASQHSEAITETLSSLWSDSLNESIGKITDRFSGFFLQLIFNLPTLGILAHAGYLTATHYFSGNYFSSEFFVHAFLTLIIILFLSFFILQALIRIFGGTYRIAANAFRIMKSKAEMWPQVASHPVSAQIDAVLGLAKVLSYEQKTI